MNNSSEFHKSHSFQPRGAGGATASQEMLKDLYARLAEQEGNVSKCEEKLVGLRKEVDATKADIVVMERAEQLFIEKEKESEGMSDDKPLRGDIASVDATSKLVRCGVAHIEDLKGCRYQHEAFLRIAEMNGGKIVLAEAADLVIAAMNPQGTRTSVLVSQRKRMQESDHWERIARGVYQLTDFGPSGDSDEANETATIDIAQDGSEKDIKPQQHAA